MTEPAPIRTIAHLGRWRREDVEPQPPAPMVESPVDAAHRAALVEHRLRERMLADQAFRRERYLQRLPRRYVDATIAGLTPEQDVDGRISGWPRSGHQSLILASSTPGLGKTHAAYAVATDAYRAGHHVEAWYVASLLGAMRPSAPEPEATQQHVLGCDLLVLDDLGRENLGSGWPVEQITLILDQRLAHARRTVVTTNLSPAEMRERYGAPLVDRLIDDAVIVKVRGESRRKPAEW